jgi:hypothetical protein
MQIGQIPWHQVPCVSNADPYRGEAQADAREEFLEEVFASAVADEGSTLEDGSTVADFLVESLTPDCAAKLAEVLKLATGLVPVGEREARNLEVVVAARELFDLLSMVYVDQERGL